MGFKDILDTLEWGTKNALAIGMRAFVDYENGRFVRAHEGCEQSLELLRDT